MSQELSIYGTRNSVMPSCKISMILKCYSGFFNIYYDHSAGTSGFVNTMYHAITQNSDGIFPKSSVLLSCQDFRKYGKNNFVPCYVNLK